eukprot:CAMPEP_0117685656 /NCGR_PEP_ID=MMETSP0804-20121206/21898_1 /TAXON_ID=1074897 /ORGANISM="Tetraselmis astigmatica, Strain CCMP880" /LENGTH=521 /DNA_ID=CAMNT_0005497027 /DNA_START=188 /DNA_END=1754 /DNA_ORIENTATION=+
MAHFDDESSGSERWQAAGGWLQNLANTPNVGAVMGVLLLNQFLFATMHNVSHTALHYIPPVMFAFFRMLFSLPFLWFVSRMEINASGKPVEITQRVVVWTFGCGLAGVAGAQTLVLLGNALAGPSLTAIMQPGIPVYTAIIAAALGVEKFSWVKMVGVLLAVSGALVLLHVEQWLHGGGASVSSQRTAGTLVLLLQSICYSVFMVMFSSLAKWFPHPFTAFFLCTFWSCIVQLLISFRSFMTFTAWGQVPASAWGAVAFCAVAISFIAHSGQAWAIRHMRPTVPSLFGCLQPPLTIAMAVMFVGEELEVRRDLTGMGLILLGMLVVLYFKNRELQGAGTARPSARPNQAYGLLIMTEHGDSAGAVEEVEMLEVEDLPDAKQLGHAASAADPFDTSMCLVSKMRCESMRANSLRGSSSTLSLLSASVLEEANGGGDRSSAQASSASAAAAPQQYSAPAFPWNPTCTANGEVLAMEQALPAFLPAVAAAPRAHFPPLPGRVQAILCTRGGALLYSFVIVGGAV